MAYTPYWNEKQGEILKIAELVKAQYPEDWKLAHSGKPGEDRYIRRVAWACREVVSPEGAVPVPRAGTVGNNWKRGVVGQLSLDALAFPNPSGAADASRQFPGLAIIDIIVGAGGPSPSLGWNDVTQATLDSGVAGGWVAAAAVTDGGLPQPVDCAAKFPPQDQVFQFGTALNEKYKVDRHAPLIGTDNEGVALYVNLKGMAIWESEYLRHRVAGMGHEEAQQATFASIDAVPL